MTSPRHPGVARALSTLLATALVLSACGGSAQGGPAPTSKNVSVVALFDRSGSTIQNKSRTGIENAIWPATFFPVIGSTYNLNVQPFGFSTGVTEWCKWKAPDSSGTEASSTEKSMSQSWAGCKPNVDRALNQKPNGDTYFDVALTKAAEALGSQAGQKKYVLLVTDGGYNKGGPPSKDIICTDDVSNSDCGSLEEAVNGLSEMGVRICPIWVSAQGAGEYPETLTWVESLQKRSKNTSVKDSQCPVNQIADLVAKPWELATTVIGWYSLILGIEYVPATTDGKGISKDSISTPNGAEAIALIGLRNPRQSPEFATGSCTFARQISFDSFDWKMAEAASATQDLCAGENLSGGQLAPGTNALIALFVPAAPRLIGCEPKVGGGGYLEFSEGVGNLLAYKPRIVWIGKGGYEALQLEDSQYLADKNQILLAEDDVERLKGKDASFTLAMEFYTGTKPDEVNSPDRMLYLGVRTELTSDGAYSAATRGVSLYAPGSNELCVGTLARDPLDRFGWLVSLLTTAIAALLLFLWWKSRQIDLTGDLAILDGTGSRRVASGSASGGNPSWFHVGDDGQIASGKVEEGKNWSLRWKGGANVALVPERETEAGEIGDWSDGMLKNDGGQGVVEFKRVPMLGTSQTNTIRYTPELGSKMSDLISKELDKDLEEPE
jgi:hypothetical protein